MFYFVLIATFRDKNFRLISSEMKKNLAFMSPQCQFLLLLNRTKFLCLYALHWLYTTDGDYHPYGHHHHKYFTWVILMCCSTIIHNPKGTNRTKAESNTALDRSSVGCLGKQRYPRHHMIFSQISSKF